MQTGELRAEAIARGYDWSIVLPRWGATWLDFILLGISAFLVTLLPESIVSWAFLLRAIGAAACYPVLEHIYGGTPGKFICRIRVVNAHCQPPSWGQAILRTILRLVEVNPFLMGGIPAGIAVLVSKKRQRLGDMAAETFVLRVRDLTAAAEYTQTLET